jgi:TPR repeat protein
MMHFIDVEYMNDTRRAKYYLTNASHGGHPDANALLSYINKEEVEKEVIFKRVFDWHMDSQNTHRLRIIFNIGWMYFEGFGTDQDYTKALYYIEHSAGRNYTDAQRLLGLIYEKGYGVNQDWTKAREWYTNAANQGNIAAHYNLGSIYYNGKGVEVNYQLALQYYQAAADQGFAGAQVNLGSLYENGHGTDQDWTKAVERYTKAVNQNNINANNSLGSIYYYGNGVEVDHQLAFQYYQTAADQGHADARVNLAEMYHRGLGIKRNSGKAIQFCSSIPNKDDNIWCLLGEIYHSADTEFQDFSKAIECYKKTDGLNMSYALRGFGLLYEYGDSVDKSYTKAMEFYTLSQDKGNKGAYYNITLLYYYGKGVCQNYFSSFGYFELVLEGDYREGVTYVIVEDVTESNSCSDRRKKNYSHVSESIIYGESHFYLGIMNEKGQGISRDHEAALYHFKYSHSYGIEKAKPFL